MDELRKLYKDNFSLCFLGNDISNKLALISLTCYLVYKLNPKKPVTHLAILEQLNNSIGKPIPEKILKGLAVVCEDLKNYVPF